MRHVSCGSRLGSGEPFAESLVYPDERTLSDRPVTSVECCQTPKSPLIRSLCWRGPVSLADAIRVSWQFQVESYWNFVGKLDRQIGRFGASSATVVGGQKRFFCYAILC
jgi:hypothetical protein